MTILDRNSKWREVCLGDHVDLLTGFPFKSAQFTTATDAIRLLKGSVVSQAALEWTGAIGWSSDDTEAYRKYELRVNDVILAMDRPWIEAGLKYAWITPNDIPSLLVQRVARLRGCNGLDTTFLRYVIGSPDFTNYIAPIVTGVNVPHISPGQIRSFRFGLPPLPVQRKVAAVLSAYDDLIANNDRRILVLCEMGQRTYREWFVDFRYPGYENIPLVESELGKIPKMWEIGVLDDLVVLQRGFDLPKSLRQDGTVPVVTSTGRHGTHKQAKVIGPGVVTGRSGSLGSVQYIVEDFWPLNTTLWVREYRRATPELAYYLLRSLDLAGFNSGSAVPTLNRNDISNLPRTLPPRLLVDRFSEHARDILFLVRVLERSTEILRATRDVLLPRLISGQIDATDFDIAMPPEAA